MINTQVSLMTYQQGKNKKVRKPDTKRSKEKE